MWMIELVLFSAVLAAAFWAVKRYGLDKPQPDDL